MQVLLERHPNQGMLERAEDEGDMVQNRLLPLRLQRSRGLFGFALVREG